MTAFVLATAASVIAYAAMESSLRDTSIGSGLLLLLIVGLLAGLNVRKKMPFFPTLTSAGWMQIHIYGGIFAGIGFLFHVGFRLPNGGLEIALALLFWIVIVSGVLGLVITRMVPKRLRTRGQPILFERHPAVLRRVRQDIARLATETTDSPTLSEFYARRLVHFLAAPRNFWWHLANSHRPRVLLLRELEAQRRYLNDEEDAIRAEIEELIVTKSDLDYHYAHQATLKYWLFVHIPLTYSLLIVAVVHGFVAYGWGRI